MFAGPRATLSRTIGLVSRHKRCKTKQGSRSGVNSVHYGKYLSWQCANSWKLRANRPWKATLRVTEFARYHRNENIQKYVTASDVYGWRSRYCCHMDICGTAGGNCRSIHWWSRLIHSSERYRIVAGIRQAFAKMRHLQACIDRILRASCMHFACIHCPGAFDLNNALLLKHFPQQSVSVATLISERLPTTSRDIDHLCTWMNYCKQKKSFTQ